jgi:hypothetical protein
VTASHDTTARLWDAATGDQIAFLSGHERALRSAAFSSDGRHVVTASDDHTARLWDVETRKEIARLKGHANWITSATFSPDGRRIVTASEDTSARLWEMQTDVDAGQSLIDQAKAIIPRCLTQAQRQQFFLDLEPPRWCITGLRGDWKKGAENWDGKWPYHTDQWKQWLATKEAGP